jgi:hypothetical protein
MGAVFRAVARVHHHAEEADLAGKLRLEPQKVFHMTDGATWRELLLISPRSPGERAAGACE